MALVKTDSSNTNTSVPLHIVVALTELARKKCPNETKTTEIMELLFLSASKSSTSSSLSASDDAGNRKDNYNNNVVSMESATAFLHVAGKIANMNENIHSKIVHLMTNTSAVVRERALVLLKELSKQQDRKVSKMILGSNYSLDQIGQFLHLVIV